MRLKLALLAGLVAISAIAWGQDGFQASIDSTAAATNSSVDLSKVHIDQLLGAQVPLATPFKDWNGRDVTMGALLGMRPAILVPIWYNCTGVCNVELQNLLTTIEKMKSRRLGADYDVIVLSINPTEGPALAAGKRSNVLNTVHMPGTENGWHFLTGTMPNIRAVTDAVGFRYTYDPVKNFANHPAGLMVLSPAGQVSSYLYGANYPQNTVVADIDLAKQGKIAPKAEELFFGCIHSDPITGKRSIVIQNVLRLMAVVTVLVLVASILTLSGKKLIRR